MEKTVAGVDEAGRGCVIGPMVVAGVLLRQDSLKALRLSGVRDSKRLTAEARGKLYKTIVEESVKLAYAIVNPALIDRYVKFKKVLGGLNVLELKAIGGIIRELKAQRVYVDCPDVNLVRWREMLAEIIPWKAELVVFHKEHDDHPAVASASIAAKVLRDSIVQKLRNIYGDFGSGYPSDPKTLKLLRKSYRSGRIPPYVRRSWKIFKLH